MARVILTSVQKDILLNDAGFKTQVKWAIQNKANYWSGHNGTTPPGGIERWRKSKDYAFQIIDNLSIAENLDAVKFFLFSLKNYACVNDAFANFDAATISDTIAFLLDDGSGGHLNEFDALSDMYFDQMIAKTR